MKISFIGHACFLVETGSGLRILFDPYQPNAFGGRIRLRPFREKVDIVASTHDHLDHYYMDPAFGNPTVVRGCMEVASITFKGITLPHDSSDGRLRGIVTGLCLSADGLTLFHPGDMGRPPTAKERAAIGQVDVMLLPVGGTFTIGPEEAIETINAIRPAIAIPMHYRSPSVDLPLRPVEDFLKLRKVYRAVSEQPLVVEKTQLPAPTEVIVLSATHEQR